MLFECFTSEEDKLHVVSCTDLTEISCGVGNQLKIEIFRAQWGQSDPEKCTSGPFNKNCGGRDVTVNIIER